ncbi:MAG: choice-of-anchor J domain-containing protein, partial [Bacteroidota bacterium]
MEKRLPILFAFTLFAWLHMSAGEIVPRDGNLQELPQIVDFELFNGVNLSEVYTGWQEGQGYLQPQYAGGAWFNGSALHGSTTATVIFSTSGLKDEWIISPQFLATENTVVSFKAALSRFWDEPLQGNFANNDSVSVLVSTNTNQFEFVHVIHSFKLDNQPGWELERYQFDLGQFAGQLIHLAFYATNGQEANSTVSFHLDDIEIKNAVARDVTPLALVSPTTGQCFSDELPVIVEIANDGF